MKILLQNFHCDSASQLVAKAVVVQMFKLSRYYYVRGKRVTREGAGPLQAASRPGSERGKAEENKKDLNSPVLTAVL